MYHVPGTDSGTAELQLCIMSPELQITMMLGHEIFDPDISKKKLVDHAIIVAGGEITKQARHWLGERLDASQRSQILFMDRADILHLFVIHNVQMPDEEQEESSAFDLGDEVPF